jgi:hypothetical protein
MQTDGNLVISGNHGKAVWSSRTNGNLVIFGSNGDICSNSGIFAGQRAGASLGGPPPPGPSAQDVRGEAGSNGTTIIFGSGFPAATCIVSGVDDNNWGFIPRGHWSGITAMFQ